MSEVRAVRHVLEAADLDCSGLVDEPSAANAVLGLRDGVVVDVGGGTTGVAIVRDGRVVYTADEATGGTHLSLVIAGALKVSYEEAEALKQDPAQQPRIFPPGAAGDGEGGHHRRSARRGVARPDHLPGRWNRGLPPLR